MTDTPDPKITQLLHDAGAGNAGAMDEVMGHVYRDLERLADIHLHRQFGAKSSAVTLEPAALVNESFMRLVEQRSGFENRGHFFAIATRVMVRVLLDYRRRREAAKRGGQNARITLVLDAHSDADDAVERAEVDVEAFARVMDEFERLDARKADIVRLRVIGGLTVPEIARALDTSPSTVERGWRFAKAWLADALEQPEHADGRGPICPD